MLVPCTRNTNMKFSIDQKRKDQPSSTRESHHSRWIETHKSWPVQQSLKIMLGQKTDGRLWKLAKTV